MCIIFVDVLCIDTQPQIYILYKSFIIFIIWKTSGSKSMSQNLEILRCGWFLMIISRSNLYKEILHNDTLKEIILNF